MSVRRSVSAGLLKNPHSTITVGDVDFLSIKYSLLGLIQLCPVPETIAFARACIGNKKYDLLFHNCEHFANACKLGVYRSHQTEQILLGKALPRALECLGDETQRETWLKEAYEDLKNQVLDKLRRDLDKSGPDQDV